jgi:hypothetical protein
MSARTRRACRAVGSVGIALFAITIGSVRAHACASCSCGDPTITAVGIEQPYKNRLRLAIETRVGEHTNGADVDRIRVLEVRTQLGLSYTPQDRITLSAFLPFVASRLLDTNNHSEWVRGLGDLELQARVLVARDRRFAPRHLFWLGAGVKAPTGPRLHDDAGLPYSDDDQPGSGSWDPLGSAVYAWFRDPLVVYTQMLFRYPTTGPRGYRHGTSVLSSTVVQLQPLRRLAVQLGADLRYAWADTMGERFEVPGTGGFVAALTPGVAVNVWRDLVVRAVVEVPVVQRLQGAQSLGPQAAITLSYDVL